MENELGIVIDYDIGDEVLIPTIITARSYDENNNFIYNVSGTTKDYEAKELTPSDSRVEAYINEKGKTLIDIIISNNIKVTLSKEEALGLESKLRKELNLDYDWE